MSSNLINKIINVKKKKSSCFKPNLKNNKKKEKDIKKDLKIEYKSNENKKK